MAVFKTIQPITISFFLFFLATTAAHAANVTFGWTPNNENISGYKIHYGTNSRNYTSVLVVNPPVVVNGMIRATVPGLQEGKTYYFAASAYSALEESTYSAEIVHTVPGTATSQPPVVGNISLQGKEDTPLSGQLNVNDPEGGTLIFKVIAQPSHGTVTVKADTGSFTYNPVPNYSGSDIFGYTASNSAGASTPATVTINLSSANDAPVASNTAFSVSEDGVFSGTLLAIDIDGDTLAYSLAAQAQKGTVTISPNGSFTYAPQRDFFGSDSFSFKVSDGTTTSNTAQVNITIQHVNKAPIAEDSSFSVNQGALYSGQLVAIDKEGDIVHFAVVTVPEKGNLLLADNGSYTYTPDADTSGEDRFTFLATDGNSTSNQGNVNIIINETANNLAFELGELLVTSDWQHVDFATEYSSPSVVAKSTTMNDSEAGVVSIRNLNSKGFDIRIREWDYLDGLHPAENISYIAMERGHHQLADNVYAVAECTKLSGLNTFQSVNFANPLSSQPVVLSSIVSENDPDAATLRMKGVTPQSFSITMQEQENNDKSHAEETVCYIAMETWFGVVDGLMVEAGTTEKILTNKISTISFKQQFPTIPFVVADMQSVNGMDTAIVGMSDLSATGARMTILEEKSADNEVNHIAEIGGYLAMAPLNPDEDSDNDGLTDREELAINTDPTLWDTDLDTINDGDEYRYWLNLGLNPEVDSDGDGLNNLLDSDSDNDGFLDGDEIAKGSDPTDPVSLPFAVEIGEISIGDSPVRVIFAKHYKKPVIIANTVTRNDTSPNVIRISNITADGFNIQLQEYDYLDNIHDLEIVSYIVMEEGSYILDDGSQVEAGLFNASATSSPIALINEFSVKPVILTSINSNNAPEAVIGRVKNITSSGFDYKLQEQEVNSQDHGLETAAYLAWTPGSGATNGIRFQAGSTSDSVTKANYRINFDQQFDNLPFHFAAMQTTDGNDTSALKIVQAGIESMETMVEEEASKDSETDHTEEIAGYLVIMQEKALSK